MSPDDPRHGTRAGYLAGCHEDCCATANYAWTTAYRESRRAELNRKGKSSRIRRERLARSGVPRSYHDASDVRAHVQRLIDMHWSNVALAEMTEGAITPSGVRTLLRGTTERVQWDTYRSLMELPISLHVPPSVSDTSWVPALGATRRTHALIALGHRHDDLAALMPPGYGRIQKGRPRMRAARWRAIDAAFQALHMQSGPSIDNRLRARKLGYLPPLAWEDIDTETVKPWHNARRHHKRELAA